MYLVRLLLGLMAIFFAHFLGRAMVRPRGERATRRRPLTWALRTAVALGGLYWGAGAGVLSIAMTLLAALSLGWGLYAGARPRRDDEETRLHLTGDDRQP